MDTEELNSRNAASSGSGMESESAPTEGGLNLGQLLETYGPALVGAIGSALGGGEAAAPAPSAPSAPMVRGTPVPGIPTIGLRSGGPVRGPGRVQTYGWDRMTVGIGVALGLLLLGGVLALRR